MSERSRVLPSWMSKKEQKVEEKEPLKTKRKQKAARGAFYCMNEKELVEVAVSCLTNGASKDVVLLTGQKVEVQAAGTAVKIKERPTTLKSTVQPVIEALEEGSSDSPDAQESTYVSETDLDITEVETLPYTKSPQHQGPEGHRSGPVRDHGVLMKVGLEAGKKEELSQVPADAVEEDDALRLVQEIFFS